MINESDWKYYSKIIGPVIEKYYSKINVELLKELKNSKLSEKEKTSQVYKKINDTYELLDGCIYRHSRSSFYDNTLCLINCGIMSIDDISGFSEEFQDSVKKHFKEIRR